MTGRLQLDPATRKEWIKQGKLSILMSPKSSSTNFPPAETQEQIIRSYCLVGATLERADLRGKNLDNVNQTSTIASTNFGAAQGGHIWGYDLESEPRA